MNDAGSLLSAEESALRELISRFPLALALLGPDEGILHANARFEAMVASPKQMSPFLPLVRNPDEGWHPIRLVGSDVAPVECRALAVRIRDSVLLVVALAGEVADLPALAELRKRVEELEQLVATDPLTGAWNRLHLDRVIEHEISRSLRFRQPVTLILVDVDHFKRVNDSLGHLAGDAVLRQLVAVLREAIRAGDLLFRWGGDEFVILAISNGRRRAALLGEKLRDLVGRHDFGEIGTLTVSVGIAEHTAGESAADWFGRVDAALYAAKTGGRNRVVADPQGSSDLWAQADGFGALRLEWLEAYECGEPTIDAQHRELFELANGLIAAAYPREGENTALAMAMDRFIEHVTMHFADEERLLEARDYAQLDGHRAVHRALLEQAHKMRAGMAAGSVRLGDVVEFLAGDVASRHLLKTDRGFFPLFSQHGKPAAG